MMEIADIKITTSVGIGLEADVGFCIAVNTAKTDWLVVSVRIVVAFKICEPSLSSQQSNV